MRILLAADGNTAMAVRDILKTNYGDQITLVEAIDGEKAIDALRDEKPFDRVIVDVHLSKRDGYEVVMKTRGSYKSAHVIALSGLAHTSHIRQQMLNLGATFIKEPFTPRELLSALGL